MNEPKVDRKIFGIVTVINVLLYFIGLAGLQDFLFFWFAYCLLQLVAGLLLLASQRLRLTGTLLMVAALVLLVIGVAVCSSLGNTL